MSCHYSRRFAHFAARPNCTSKPKLKSDFLSNCMLIARHTIYVRNKNRTRTYDFATDSVSDSLQQHGPGPGLMNVYECFTQFDAFPKKLIRRMARKIDCDSWRTGNRPSTENQMQNRTCINKGKLKNGVLPRLHTGPRLITEVEQFWARIVLG
jgi:hypothetical protein